MILKVEAFHFVFEIRGEGDEVEDGCAKGVEEWLNSEVEE